jgi:hypothetical protein
MWILVCVVCLAYDLAWQMEEVLAEEPDHDKLANCGAAAGAQLSLSLIVAPG